MKESHSEESEDKLAFRQPNFNASCDSSVTAESCKEPVKGEVLLEDTLIAK